MIMAVMASHRLISERVNGNLMVFYSWIMLIDACVVEPSGAVSIFRIITDLPEDLAMAQAAALMMGQPNILMLLRLFSWLKRFL